ncbi:MAG: hypothetical protein JRJ29_18405, partial [Deltaproteobacteria bacterium]|nr:hypothetical protein [Deltaproteobacteria bacterium]
EKMKASFRMAYSLFDKIAFFLNHYLRLSIPERNVSLRTIWYKSQNRKGGLRDEFTQRQNWPLRGLFWLSKDLYEDKPGFKESIEPDAQELHEIRNHLEPICGWVHPRETIKCSGRLPIHWPIPCTEGIFRKRR